MEGKVKTMADITMCNGRECPDREKCYRHKARPSDWQSMAAFDEGRLAIGECENFYPMPGDEAEYYKKHQGEGPGDLQF